MSMNGTLPTPEDIKRVKGLGFLHDKTTADCFNARVITRNGRLQPDEIRAIVDAAEKFGSGEIAAWSISESPNMAQQDEMLDMLVPLVPAGAHPVMQSDMGWQYQSAGYVERLRGAGFVQSMSRKGNCLDNACTEGLFGHMKDEFFRGRDWDDFESFKADLEAYIVHWNTRRRQKRLKGLTPEEFRNQSLMAA